MTSQSESKPAPVGQGDFVYQPLAQWEKLPEGMSFYEAVSVACDSQDRVYVFNRGEHPLIVLDRDGNFIRAWEEHDFVRAHGIWIGPDDAIYLIDDLGQTVGKYSPEGESLLTLGEREVANDPDDVGFDYRKITRGGPAFNFPTDLALSPDGEMYVADGYGNCRVHKFSPAGELMFSWGEPGDGPGQFHLPHGIGVDGEGKVYVADRENSRVQIFTPDGKFLTEWNDMVRPTEVFIDRNGLVYVTELGRRAGLFTWMESDPTSTGGRLSIFDLQGNLKARWGGGDNPCQPGDFYTPHDVWVDSQGSIYVAEVTMSGGGKQGLIPAECPSLTKFVRQ